jgi:hypothetical protein
MGDWMCGRGGGDTMWLCRGILGLPGLDFVSG